MRIVVQLTILAVLVAQPEFTFASWEEDGDETAATWRPNNPSLAADVLFGCGDSQCTYPAICVTQGTQIVLDASQNIDWLNYPDFLQEDGEEVGFIRLEGTSLAQGDTFSVYCASNHQLVYGCNGSPLYPFENPGLEGGFRIVIRAGAGPDTIYLGEWTNEFVECEDYPGWPGSGGGWEPQGEAGDDTIYTALGTITAYGDDGNDTLYGTDRDDNLRGDHDVDYGDDCEDEDDCDEGFVCSITNKCAHFCTNSCDDTIVSGDATNGDRITGGAGNDTLIAGDGNDLISGGYFGHPDDPTHEPAEGEPYIGECLHETGDDTIVGGAGRDVIHGCDGDDTIEPGDDEDEVYGGAGSDTIYDGSQYANVNKLSGGTWSEDWSWTSPELNCGADVVVGVASSGADVITGAFGVDTIVGCGGDDEIEGLGSADVIVGGDGQDTIDGGSGDDDITGGDDGDEIHGGAGGDEIDGGGGADTILGGAGLDTIDGGAGGDSIDGGGDDDVITGGDGADTIFGGLGDDEIEGESGDDCIAGGGGGDTVDGGGDDDVVYGDCHCNLTWEPTNGWQCQWDLRMRCPVEVEVDVVVTGECGPSYTSRPDLQSVDELHGSSGMDDIDGGPGDDFLFGDEDADELHGGLDSDEIYGFRPCVPTDCTQDPKYEHDAADIAAAGVTTWGDEDDPGGFIDGGKGNDSLYGGPGPDVIYGGHDADQIYGRGGDDELLGEDGADFIAAGEGDDEVQGDGGDDELFGQDGNDTLAGGDDDDFLVGGGDDDALLGEGDADELLDFQGDNALFGGDGEDILVAEGGDVVLEGGAGADYLCAFDTDYSIFDCSNTDGVVDHYSGCDDCNDCLGGTPADVLDPNGCDSLLED